MKEHKDELGSMLEEYISVKCICIEKNYDGKVKYSVEIYDIDNQVCFNNLFGDYPIECN
jgi:hypothetical protein